MTEMKAHSCHLELHEQASASAIWSLESGRTAFHQESPRKQPARPPTMRTRQPTDERELPGRSNRGRKRLRWRKPAVYQPNFTGRTNWRP